MRGLHTVESARKYLDGWLVHYNFFRPHMSLRDSSPARVAGIQFPFRNWKDIVEQPFEVTARIPIKEYIPMPDDTSVPETIRKAVKSKKPIKRGTRSHEKPVTSLSKLRVK